MTSREANGALSELSSGDGEIREFAHRASRAKLTTVLGVAALLGAVAGAGAGAAKAMRSQSDDVISGKVSIDLLKKVELLTIRLRLHRS